MIIGIVALCWAGTLFLTLCLGMQMGYDSFQEEQREAIAAAETEEAEFRKLCTKVAYALDRIEDSRK